MKTPRERTIAHGMCCVISSADFLDDPKRAVAMVAKGRQVCVKGDKTQIIIGLRHAKVNTAQRNALYRRTAGAMFFARSKVEEPVSVSWIA